MPKEPSPLDPFTFEEFATIEKLLTRYHLDNMLHALWLILAIRAATDSDPQRKTWQSDADILALITPLIRDRDRPPGRLFIIY